MNEKKLTEGGYSEAVQAIKAAILRSQYKAARAVNAEQLSLYYGIGRYVSLNSREGFWGTGAIATISRQLQKELPGLRGFSASNIKNMRQFYEEWEPAINRQPMAGDLKQIDVELNKDMIDTNILLYLNRPPMAVDLDTEELLSISFSHHIEILNKTTTLEERTFMENNTMKYLIAGTGGVGGSIAAFLSLAGKDVTCIARGEHLATIRRNGLRLHSDLKGEHTLQVKACTVEEYNETADVIFVCVKGYSVDSITELIKRAAHRDTVVIPILNVYGTGPRIQRLVPGVTVLDGCIYIVGFVSGHGEISQMGKIFRLVYGAHKGTVVPRGTLETIRQDLEESGIKAEISEDINRDTFVKWSFISAMAVTGAYYDVPMGEVQKPGKVRDTFIGLSQESAALGAKLGIEFQEDVVEYNLKVMDKLAPESTASMQKDMARGHESEVQGLLFDMIAAAEEQGVDTPTYKMVAEKFKPRNPIGFIKPKQ